MINESISIFQTFIYFVVIYFYQLILARILISYLEIDPVTVSIILSAFLSFSKSIGGLLFGVAFWNISKTVSYEKNIRTYMIISGWGFFLVFAANQAAVTNAHTLSTLWASNINCFEYSRISNALRDL